MKKILLIEDKDNQRDATHYRLTNYKFEVYSAGTVSEARKLAEQYWNSLDVAVLDMRLEDPNDPHITGADIGIEFSKKQENSPECIIFSAYAEVEYYKLAMNLGAVTYLDKYHYDYNDLIRHIRVIAMRKALITENSEAFQQIIETITQSSDRKNAVEIYCQKVLSPEFEMCLGTPFFFILSSDDNSAYCAGNVNLPPESSRFYSFLKTLAENSLNVSNVSNEPVFLDSDRLRKETDEEVLKEFEILDGAALLSLFSSKEYKISLTLVILREKEINLDDFAENEEIIPPNKTIESPLELWKVLNQYLKPVIVDNIFKVLSEWNNIKSKIKFAIQTNTLREFAQICIWIGQEQSALLRNSTSLDDPIVSKLQAMADDLTESGNLLRHIEKPLDEDIKYTPLSTKDLLDEIWDSISDAEESGNEFKFTNNADCIIEAQENDLYVVFSRLLQWFIKRRISTSPEIEPIITVSCDSEENDTSIIFTDKSKRLNETIRKELFVPFTQSISIPFNDLSKGDDKNHIPGQYLPLYIAKMIVEVKYGGEFIDATDDLEGNSGHKFILRFTKDRVDS